MSGGGCFASSQCDGPSNNCFPAIQLYQCCRIDALACYTQVIGLMARQDQAIDANTPRDEIFNGVLIKKVGVMAIGDSRHFKAGEIITQVDGLPAHAETSWAAWLKKGAGDSIFTVADADTHKTSDRTITRL